MFFSSNIHECQWCQWRDRQNVDAERLRLNGDGQITLHIALTEGVCVCVCVWGGGHGKISRHTIHQFMSKMSNSEAL